MIEGTRVLAFIAVLALGLNFVRTPGRGHDVDCEDAGQSCFLDTDGAARSATSAYRALHLAEEPHHLRALAEEIVFITFGTTWYWLARDKNLIDWDRPSAKARFTLDVIRFDNNDFPVNFTLHPWSGAAYYSAARTNGISLWGSAGYALGATLAWEYAIEFREKVSISDLFFTPLPAITLGEFFSQLARYVNRPTSKPSRWQRAAGWIFGPLQAFSDLFEKQPMLSSAPSDSHGFSAHMHAAFRIYAGVAAQQAEGGESLLADVGAEGTFVSIPSWSRPGRFRKLVHDGDFARFWLSAVKGGAEREFDSYADLSLFGAYEQRIDRDSCGGAVFVGSTLGYRYRRSFLEGFRDEVAATHLPGFALEGLLSSGPQARFRISYRLHPDFAGVRTLSYEQWQAANLDAIGKTVVERHGYVYAFGVTSLLELSLSWQRVQLGGRTWFAAYNSKEGLDRTQEMLTADPKGEDHVLDAEAWLSLSPWHGTGFFLELALLARQRSSRLAGYETRIRLGRASVRTGLRF